MADFRGYVTAAGQTFEALAKQMGYPVTIGFIEVGDGKLPDSESPIDRTQLVHKLKQFPAIVEQDTKNPGQWVATCYIPADDAIDGAGYFIREIGCKLLNQGDGVLYAYRRVSDDWKPVITSGEAKSFIYKLRFIPSNGELLTPTIDPSVVLVDKEELARVMKAHVESTDHPYATDAEKGFVRLAKTDELASDEPISGDQPVVTVDQLRRWAANNGGKIPSIFSLWKRALSEVGIDLIGRFGSEITIESPAQAVLSKDGQNAFSWTGSLPKHLSINDTPESSGGVSPGNWKSENNNTISKLLADPRAGGGSIIGFSTGENSEKRKTVQDKLSETISATDYAIGDGISNDTSAFERLERDHIYKKVDLLGLSYVVNDVPSGNIYMNGVFLVSGKVIPALYSSHIRSLDGVIALGDGALSQLPLSYNRGNTSTLLALGRGAMELMEEAKTSVAIGNRAMGKGRRTRDNIAIGDDALLHVEADSASYDQSKLGGTRNISLGGNSSRFLVKGYNNLVAGRNAGQGLVNSSDIVILGANAMAGYCPIGLSGDIENWNPAADGANQVVAVGALSFRYNSANYGVAVGHRALFNNKKSTGNTGVGPQVFEALDSLTWVNGGQYIEKNIGGTYSHLGNALKMSFVGHGASVGDTVIFRLLDGISQTFQGDQVPAIVTAVNGNEITVNHPVSRTASGNAVLLGVATSVQQPLNGYNTGVGCLVGYSAPVAVENTLGGYGSGRYSPELVKSTAWGFRSLTGSGRQERCSAFGHDALRFVSGGGGTVLGALRNSTGVGANASVSGDNQVQLGDSDTTTYVFGTVQNRSDERDKADWEDTALGIDFIMGLRPVDGYWDLRDDYYEEYIVQVGIDLSTAEPIFENRRRLLPKDGSKKRKRKHHWFIAQEVKRLCDEMGVEFGGYQDHSVNGGADVLTLGYDEFIPPITKAVQDCWNEISEIKKKMSQLVKNNNLTE